MQMCQARGWWGGAGVSYTGAGEGWGGAVCAGVLG